VRASARATAREDHLAVHLEGEPIKRPFSFTGQATFTVSVGIADSMQAVPLNAMDGALPGPIHESSPHQPHPPQPQAPNSPEETLESRLAWHKVWNPLELDAPAKLFERQGLLLLYLFFCNARYVVFPIFTLLVLLGDPTQDNLGIVKTTVSTKSTLSDAQILYILILIAVTLQSCLFAVHAWTRIRTFFQLVLVNEWKREKKRQKFITCSVLLFYAGYVVMVNWKFSDDQKQCEKEEQQGCVDLNGLSADAPRFTSLPYWILILAFLFAFWDVFSYNNVFNEIMLPRAQDIHEQYPDEFKAASYYGDRDCGTVDRCMNSWCQAPGRFEPNIHIEPEGFCWLLTDTSTVLTSVIIVCDRVAVHLNRQSEAQASTLTEKISVWRSRFNGNSVADKAIHDSSLGWGYVSVHPTILLAIQ
jgi:hypothetical protein